MKTIEIVIDDLFVFLLKETKLFMEQTYGHACNYSFRNHPNKNAKASVLANLYLLTPVILSFENKGIKSSSIKHMENDELSALFSPCQVFFHIDDGESSLQKLICIYYLVNKNINPIIYIENNLLIINCAFTNIRKAINEDFDVLLSQVVSGGEESIKKAIEHINEKIPFFNKEIFDYALMICA